MDELSAREALCEAGRSLYERRYTHGATGNLSIRLPDGFLITPTGARLGALRPDTLARLDLQGRHVAGPPPSKEAPLHLSVYAARPQDHAIVHLHATHAAAVSCLADLPPEGLPPLTGYFVMRLQRLERVGYHPPGDPELAAAVGEGAARHHALLLDNHGPLVSGADLAGAVEAAEELEQTAQLHLLLRGSAVRALSPADVARTLARVGPGPNAQGGSEPRVNEQRDPGEEIRG
jgi:3-dehydro-4-phosphotetronate decarboxylase